MKCAMCAAVGLSLSFLAAGSAQADTIATDRPDFVESSNTVGADRWQIETSFLRETDDDGPFEATGWATPTLLRIGLGENWEARIETDGFVDASLRGPGLRADEDGFSDTSIGLKYHVPGSGENGGPSMAWLFHVDLESGSEAFRGKGARPSVRLVAEWDLGNDWGLGVMPGVAWENGDNGRYVSGIFGAVVGKGWTDRFRTFTEIAMQQIASNEDGGTQATFDVGAAYLLTDNAQWDVAIYKGLNDRTPDLGVTSGLSLRW